METCELTCEKCGTTVTGEGLTEQEAQVDATWKLQEHVCAGASEE